MKKFKNTNENTIPIFLEKGDYFDSSTKNDEISLIKKNNDAEVILDRKHFREAFNTNAYLRVYYYCI